LPNVFDAAADFNARIIGIKRPDTPTMLTPARIAAFREHLTEESDELLFAETVADQIDALEDIIFIAAGRLYELGADGQAHFDEISRANGSRVRGDNKKRPNAGGYDAVKPEGWVGPNHEAIIEATVGGQCLSIPVKPNKRIILLGYGRHGKDTVAEMLRDKYGYRFQASSVFLAERVMMPYFNSLQSHIGYASVEECFEDRHNHRATWFEQIELFNYPDRTKLATELFKQNDVYVGMRSAKELQACKVAGTADLIIWVDASDRMPPEDKASCTVEPWMADYIIDNNGTLEDLAFNVDRVVEHLGL
jgi:predicted HAD superfamily Cof-like phosphohydrolase